MKSGVNFSNFECSLGLSLDMAGFHICETRLYMELIMILTISVATPLVTCNNSDDANSATCCTTDKPCGLGLGD